MKKYYLKGRYNGWHIAGHLFFFTAITIALGYLIMFLWNSIIPNLFNISTITYWQSIGLFVLARIFFGGIWKSDWCSGYNRIKHDYPENSPIYKKWASMTSEQQKDYIAKRREHFRHDKHHYFDQDLKNDQETGK